MVAESEEQPSPRSTEDLLSSLRDMRDRMKAGHVLREPQFVITQTEAVRLYDWEMKTREKIRELERRLEFELNLSSERLTELTHEKLRREAYQCAAEVGIETIQELRAALRLAQAEEG
jgi:hypothetical protein